MGDVVPTEAVLAVGLRARSGDWPLSLSALLERLRLLAVTRQPSRRQKIYPGIGDLV